MTSAADTKSSDVTSSGSQLRELAFEELEILKEIGRGESTARFRPSR